MVQSQRHFRPLACYGRGVVELARAMESRRVESVLVVPVVPVVPDAPVVAPAVPEPPTPAPAAVPPIGVAPADALPAAPTSPPLVPPPALSFRPPQAATPTMTAIAVIAVITRVRIPEDLR